MWLLFHLLLSFMMVSAFCILQRMRFKSLVRNSLVDLQTDIVTRTARKEKLRSCLYKAGKDSQIISQTSILFIWSTF